MKPTIEPKLIILGLGPYASPKSLAREIEQQLDEYRITVTANGLPLLDIALGVSANPAMYIAVVRLTGIKKEEDHDL